MYGVTKRGTHTNPLVGVEAIPERFPIRTLHVIVREKFSDEIGGLQEEEKGADEHDEKSTKRIERNDSMTCKPISERRRTGKEMWMTGTTATRPQIKNENRRCFFLCDGLWQNVEGGLGVRQDGVVHIAIVGRAGEHM